MDREKVISGLMMLADAKNDDTCEGLKCCKIAEDALELLKEQEAVEPIEMQRMDGNFSFFVPYFLCGNCRYELIGKDVMFCSHCGRSVKRHGKSILRNDS